MAEIFGDEVEVTHDDEKSDSKADVKQLQDA